MTHAGKVSTDVQRQRGGQTDRTEAKLLARRAEARAEMLVYIRRDAALEAMGGDLDGR